MSSIQNGSKLRALATAALVTMGLGAASMALAGAPIVTISVPQTVYTTLPATIPFTVTVEHSDAGGLSSVQGFGLKIDGVWLAGFPINSPFPSNGCNHDQMVQPLISSCSVAGDVATVVVPWHVTEAGTYAIVGTARHGGAEDDDEVTIITSVVNVEWPAPPAVANNLLKGTKLKGGVHGCIISNIANEHAMNSKYGDKGGPYNQGMIAADVESFRVQCGG